MYHYLDDKEFLKAMRNLSGDIMQQLCHILKEDYDIGANFYLVGSGAKNLIMQNEALPVDLDYNLNIVKCENDDCHYIKKCVKAAFDEALDIFDLAKCNDSKSVLNTKKIHFTGGNQTGFSIDVCIVTTDGNGNMLRLIHKKTGYSCYDEYYWNQSLNLQKLQGKVKYIKDNGKWLLVREQYKDIKNGYLRCNDHNHPSYICYAEAVNNVYNMMR